ncbi:MAG: hypothetical protein HFG26_07870 [Provencibacterium sp.]|jgi:hypothetical protein|nr:hypothetical protein [Provencibacterium sp.]
MEGIKAQADRILYELGLLDELEKYGAPHIIGSYQMDAMAWNDLDIDVTNERMSLERLYRLTASLLQNYRPLWYEAKQETDSEGKTVWFHGFEAILFGERWNVDIWFFDEETIRRAEAFGLRMKRQFEWDGAKRDTVIRIKKALIDRGLYAGAPFTSMDVYRAVLEKGILSEEDFLQCYAKDSGAPPGRR